MYEDKTSAEVIADGTWDGVRLVSFRATLPTIVQFHLLRHRAFSFSFASMRAIPLSRQMQLVKENPFVPQAWPKNRSGMSATENLPEYQSTTAELGWLAHLEDTLEVVGGLSIIGVHKEIASRLLLPFSWSTCIISSTMPGLDNFFAQRDHEDAQPEIRTLARAMRKALDESEPIESPIHIPFFDSRPEAPNVRGEATIIRAVAHCARVSYGREMEEKTYEEDVALVTRLLRDGHASPFEHLAAANTGGTLNSAGNFSPPWSQIRHNIQIFLPSIVARIESDVSAGVQ